MLVLQKGKSQISIVLTLSKIQIIDKCDFSKKHSTSKHFYTCWLFHYNYDNMNILLQLLPISKGIHGHYNVFFTTNIIRKLSEQKYTVDSFWVKSWTVFKTMSLLCFNSSQNDVNCPNVYFEELYATLPRISLYVKHFKCIFFAKKNITYTQTNMCMFNHCMQIWYNCNKIIIIMKNTKGYCWKRYAWNVTMCLLFCLLNVQYQRGYFVLNIYI